MTPLRICLAKPWNKLNGQHNQSSPAWAWCLLLVSCLFIAKPPKCKTCKSEASPLWMVSSWLPWAQSEDGAGFPAPVAASPHNHPLLARLSSHSLLFPLSCKSGLTPSFSKALMLLKALPRVLVSSVSPEQEIRHGMDMEALRPACNAIPFHWSRSHGHNSGPGPAGLQEPRPGARERQTGVQPQPPP